MRTKDQDKQQRIKDAMVHLILREGINGTSVAKIAKEAGVSPATIYVYYENKEEMLSAVFQECSHSSYQYLMQKIRPDMGGRELIDTIVHGYYAFTVEHEEIFSFVEQCSRCPTLAEQVCEAECTCDLFDLIHAYQDRGEMKPYSDWNMMAALFAPVRFLAQNRRTLGADGNARLEELVEMLQTMLLT